MKGSTNRIKRNNWSLAVRLAVRMTKTHRMIGGLSLWKAKLVERETGLEPATTCLGSRCATIAPLSHALNVAAFRIVVRRMLVGCRANAKLGARGTQSLATLPAVGQAGGCTASLPH